MFYQLAMYAREITFKNACVCIPVTYKRKHQVIKETALTFYDFKKRYIFLSVVLCECGNGNIYSEL